MLQDPLRIFWTLQEDIGDSRKLLEHHDAHGRSKRFIKYFCASIQTDEFIGGSKIFQEALGGFRIF
jgi:hypothetical protein